MDSPLPQRFPWNLWWLLQSNPLLPSQALEAHQTQFSFQAHPGSPSLSISVPALALHPKTRSPKAAKHKKCLDTPHTAESNSSHIRQLRYFKRRISALFFHPTASWLQDFPGGEKPWFKVLITQRRLRNTIYSTLLTLRTHWQGIVKGHGCE